MHFRNLLSFAALALLMASCQGSRPSAANPSTPFDPLSLGPAGQSLKLYLEQKPDKNGSAVDLVIDAAIPNMDKRGTMKLVRSESDQGKISFDALSYEGDNTIKIQVIARYLSFEEQAPPVGLAVDNYKFKFKRMDELNGYEAAVFELQPKRKQLGLFKGELWLQESTGLPLRISGRFVKNPSVIFKTMDFTRDYEVRDGKAFISRLQSESQTRIVGKVLMNMVYSNHRTLTNTPSTETSTPPTASH
jgi:hypothetical protein